MTDLYGYIDRIEAAFDDPAQLRVLQRTARDDGDLIAGDLDLVLERIATYLADAQRAGGQIDTTDADGDDAADQ